MSSRFGADREFELLQPRVPPMRMPSMTTLGLESHALGLQGFSLWDECREKVPQRPARLRRGMRTEDLSYHALVFGAVRTVVAGELKDGQLGVGGAADGLLGLGQGYLCFLSCRSAGDGNPSATGSNNPSLQRRRFRGCRRCNGCSSMPPPATPVCGILQRSLFRQSGRFAPAWGRGIAPTAQHVQINS